VTRTQFLAWLDDLGIPHSVALRDLEARYGLSQSTYYDWLVLHISDAHPLVLGQVEPPDVLPNKQPELLPPPYFSALVSTDPDARTNHAQALAALTRQLGVPRDVSTSNTLGQQWTFDTAFLSLVAWPPELPPNASLENAAHARHPEMKAFAHLTFAAGHLVPLSDQEKQWMATALPLAPAGSDATGLCPDLSSDGWSGGLGVLASPLRGSFRRLPPELATRHRFVGASADSAALVCMNGESAFLVPREHIVGIDLARIAPARGPGGSTLAVRFRDPFSSPAVERSQNIFAGASPASLDETARAVARWAERQVRTSDDGDD
jgi:hypothetical protein